jgi:hypothetical protein
MFCTSCPLLFSFLKHVLHSLLKKLLAESAVDYVLCFVVDGISFCEEARASNHSFSSSWKKYLAWYWRPQPWSRYAPSENRGVITSLKNPVRGLHHRLLEKSSHLLYHFKLSLYRSFLHISSDLHTFSWVTTVSSYWYKVFPFLAAYIVISKFAMFWKKSPWFHVCLLSTSQLNMSYLGHVWLCRQTPFAYQAAPQVIAWVRSPDSLNWLLNANGGVPVKEWSHRHPLRSGLSGTPSIPNCKSFDFFYPKFDYSSYSKKLYKYSQI